MTFFKGNRNPFVIFLYDEPSSKTLDVKEIKEYLRQVLGDIEVKTRGDFIGFHLNTKRIDEYAEELARCKVRDLFSSKPEAIDVLPGEIRYERKLIEHPEKKLTGVLYDGYRLDRFFRSLIPHEELDFKFLHIVFTNRLFGTYDEKDRRYHARVIICGYPSIISTTGIVEAPAKPKEFYLLKQKYSILGMEMPYDAVKEDLHGRFIDYDDPCLTEVMKGYVMQSVFYHLTLEPFCEDKNCRLYNAHWQEEVINAQLKGTEFCRKHKQVLRGIRERLREENKKKARAGKTSQWSK
jgi:acid stress-induced BolA-like protein IbaG/YrbA